MDHSLKEAAKQGNIEALYSSIRRDPKVLDKIDDIPFVDTPLHTAATAGNTGFAMEVMMLKPSFARKLNQDGLTPMHLALRNNKTQVVLRLLDVDKDSVRVQGKGGVTPLHYAAETEKLHILAEFLKVCPKSIEDVTIRRETALHVALKNNKLDAFQLLVGWVRRAWFRNALSLENKCLNWKDDEGNTVLHIAVSRNLPQVVRRLLGCNVNINAENGQGSSALDILQGSQVVNQEIRDILRRAGALSSASSPPGVASLSDHLRSPVSTKEKLDIFVLRRYMEITNDVRNALLVVAALLVTVTYQASLSPPGGVWQDSYNPGTDQSKISTAPISASTSEVSTQPPHLAGTVVMMRPNISHTFFFFNGLTFSLTNLMLIMLLPCGFTRVLFTIALWHLFTCYFFSTAIIFPKGA